jgi:uncharacterized protein (TIGR03086 family)
MSEEVTILKSVTDKTASLISGVNDDQLKAPTPCTDWDVRRLMQHLVGWAENFADRAEGKEPPGEPDSVSVGNGDADRFRAATHRLVTALDSSEPLPEKAPQPGILIAEYVLHGSDLATATGQDRPFSDDEAEPGLQAMRGMLKPEYRGNGFEAEVLAPDDAGALVKLLAFSGRQP